MYVNDTGLSGGKELSSLQAYCSELNKSNQVWDLEAELAQTHTRTQKIKSFAADTLASITYGLTVGTAFELGYIGLQGWQCVQSRAASIPMNTLFGGLYGKYLDFMFHALGVPKKRETFTQKIGAYTTEAVLFVGFWYPVYANIISHAGADLDQLLRAFEVTNIMAFTSAPVVSWLRNNWKKRLGVIPPVRLR